MTIIAIGSPEQLKKVQQAQNRLANPSLKLTEDMKAAAGDETLTTWQHLAAEMQKIGYVRVWLEAFELLGKHCPKGFTALKQTVVSGAVEECLQRFAEKHYFEGERLERTMKRIGAIFLLARKVDREHFVQFSFGPILDGHGVTVPGYLKLTAKPEAVRREEHRRVSAEREPLRPSAREMFKNAPPKASLAIRPDGTVYEVRKHKPITVLTPEKRAEREKQHAEDRAKRAAAKAAKAQEEAKRSGKGGGKKQQHKKK